MPSMGKIKILMMIILLCAHVISCLCQITDSRDSTDDHVLPCEALSVLLSTY